jgi:alkylhydroperoxidase family enzyme
MAWIETTREDEWSGELAKLLTPPPTGVLDPEHGRVDNILQIHSLDPRGLAAHASLYRSAMTGTRTLRKAERELIALVVSRINGCHY